MRKWIRRAQHVIGHQRGLSPAEGQDAARWTLAAALVFRRVRRCVLRHGHLSGVQSLSWDSYLCACGLELSGLQRLTVTRNQRWSNA